MSLRNRVVLSCALLVGLCSPTGAEAQLPPTYTFTIRTVINPDEVNANFALLQHALDRRGGTMTGTLTALGITADALTVNATSSSAAAGKLHFNTVDGITQSGRTGSTSDLAWYNAAGAKAAYLRAGTGRWVFGTNSPGVHAGVVIEGVDADAFFGTVSTSTDPAREGGFLAFLKMANGSYYKSGVWAATVGDDTVASGFMCTNIHASYMNASVQKDDVWILGCGKQGVVFWPSGSTSGYAALMPGERKMHIRGTVFQGDAELTAMPDQGDFRVPNGWDLYGRNAADTNNVQILALSTTNEVELGDNDTKTVLKGSVVGVAGATSSYPALKRSGTNVQVRLGDDSAYGGIDVGSILLSGTSLFATTNTWTAAQTLAASSNVVTLRATTNGNNFTRIQNAAGTTKWQFYLSGGGEDWTMYSSGADPGTALLIEAGTRDVYIPGGNLYVTGTQTIGGGSSISSSSDLARVNSSNTFTGTANSFASSATVVAGELGDATLTVKSDDGDDAGDRWSVVVDATNNRWTWKNEAATVGGTVGYLSTDGRLVMTPTANGLSGYGASIQVQRSASSGNAPGTLIFDDASASSHFVWADTTGDLRINAGSGATPTSGDTIGTVVGDQTSLRAAKVIHGAFTDYNGALQAMIAAPLWSWSYANGRYHGEQFMGITLGDGPENFNLFGKDRGRVFNELTFAGYTIASFKALEARVAALEKGKQ